ncbi:Circadian clock protein KaiC [Planctomycetales bacterium 10988]|nr:Circadian clock protein KaiC [Planctomycetales bacterium 10988]
MATLSRHSTGISELDAHLGGGLLPGTLTVLVGATGIGKTQLGLSYAHAGSRQERPLGILFDMASRGDSQGHESYAERLFDWNLNEASVKNLQEMQQVFESAPDGNLLRLFQMTGRRVTRRDLDFDDFRDWQQLLTQKLDLAYTYFYRHFIHGVRRVVFDGFEPVERSSDSLQLELLELLYHRCIRQESEWVAREVLRQRFRSHQEEVEQFQYPEEEISSVLLQTSAESMLDHLIEKPLGEGDVLSNANTVIYLGKTREGGKFGRALYIAKHRGSACTEDIIPYVIEEAGIRLL